MASASKGFFCHLNTSSTFHFIEETKCITEKDLGKLLDLDFDMLKAEESPEILYYPISGRLPPAKEYEEFLPLRHYDQFDVENWKSGMLEGLVKFNNGQLPTEPPGLLEDLEFRADSMTFPEFYAEGKVEFHKTESMPGFSSLGATVTLTASRFPRCIITATDSKGIVANFNPNTNEILIVAASEDCTAGARLSIPIPSVYLPSPHRY